MADILLNKVINEEIDINVFVKWISRPTLQNEEFNLITDCNVEHIGFVTYFLNFVHQELQRNEQTETPLNTTTPKQIGKVSITKNEKSVKRSIFSTPPTTKNQASVSGAHTQITSTPIPSKHQSHSNTSYLSPVSPLYQNGNVNNVTSRESKSDNNIRTPRTRNALCLGDFLVTSGKSSSKKKRQSTESVNSKKEVSRRINPTSISETSVNNDFQKTGNSFDFQKNVEETPLKAAIEQRDVLVEERNKILFRKDGLEQTNQPIILKRRNSIPKCYLKPQFNLVSYKKNIGYLVDIYSTILDHKLVLNITSEIYFLISASLNNIDSNQSSSVSRYTNIDNRSLGVEALETGSASSHAKPDIQTINNTDIFENSHNIVYFAIKCLERQIKILHYFDNFTIRLLADNERMKEFSPKFCEGLLICVMKKSDIPYNDVITPISQTNVCFNMDKDNVDNFPTHMSFHSFRKQRDLFYDILRIWETYHLTSDWDFGLRLGGKIRSLFNLCNEPANYFHLVRLFKNQLLSSCAKGLKEKGLSEKNKSLIPSLPIDVNKLNMLTNRLVTKQVSAGMNSPPVFSGHQEFFKDFIVVAANHFFNKHLCDSLASEIIELNETKFSEPELMGDEKKVDDNTRKLYINCVKNLRVLAKFLGFVESMPYKSEVTNMPINVLEAQISIRSQAISSLNIESLIESAIEKHTIVFLIPWLTKYLAMLDYVTLRTPYFKSIHSILFDLYKNYDTSEISCCNAVVIKFCLGWLFELPHFPNEEYFKFCSNKSANLRQYHSAKCEIRGKLSLDSTDIANQNVLYLCCPYLEEIKKLLSCNAPGSRTSVKYITPITAVQSNNELFKKRLEQQLEEAFFNGQPSSLRKTVEFVSERVASVAVKYICHDLVPGAKRKSLEDFKHMLFTSSSVEKLIDENQAKLLKGKSISFAQTCLSDLLKTCDEKIEETCTKNIPVAIRSLMPLDTLETTLTVCIEIAKKMYLERVNQWVNSHVDVSVFSKEFDSEVQKFSKRKKSNKGNSLVLPEAGKNCDHNENALSGFHALNLLRDACCNVTETKEVTLEYVVDVLNEIYKSLTQRNDVNDMISAVISVTTFDFYLLVVAASPSLFLKSDDLFNYFTRIWNRFKPNSSTKSLICARNVEILQSGSDTEKTWELHAKMISCLIDKKLVEQDDVESQCTGFYTRDWDPATLSNFSHFLRKLVSFSNCDNAFILDFLSDFCSDL